MPDLKPVVVEFLATGPTQPDLRSDYTSLTATVVDWRPELLDHLSKQPAFAGKEFGDDSILTWVTGQINSISLALMGEGLACGNPSITSDPVATHLGVGAVAKVKARYACSAEQLQDIQSRLIDALADLFDGYARLELEVCEDDAISSICLSTGRIETEPCPLSSLGPLDLHVGLKNGVDSAHLSFDICASILNEILTCAPARLRATPGGRRDLALLFLETEIEAALECSGQPDKAFSMVDRSGLDHKSISIEINAATSQNDLPSSVAETLIGRWPSIFS